MSDKVDINSQERGSCNKSCNTIFQKVTVSHVMAFNVTDSHFLWIIITCYPSNLLIFPNNLIMIVLDTNRKVIVSDFEEVKLW